MVKYTDSFSNKNAKEDKDCDDDSSSKRNKNEPQTQINSWDCSSNSGNEESPKYQNSDLKLNNDCHETMVEPFDSNTEGSSSTTSFSLPDLSEADKKSIFDLLEASGNKNYHSRCSLKQNLNDKNVKDEDLLLVEDIEEFPKDCSQRTSYDRSIRSELEHEKSKLTERTQDDTIWVIPKSEESSTSNNTDSRLELDSDEVKLKNLDLGRRNYIKKFKSSTQITKINKRSTRSTKSDRIENVDYERLHVKKFLLKSEGCSIANTLEIESKVKDTSDGSEKPGMYFAEYECRTMTMNKNTEPEKSRNTSDSVFSSTEEIISETHPHSVVANDNYYNNNVNMRNEPNENVNERALAGPSNPISMEVMSLPDIIGRKQRSERIAKGKNIRKIDGHSGKTRKEIKNEIIHKEKATESWFLLDDRGQYLEVVLNLIFYNDRKKLIFFFVSFLKFQK